MAQMANNSLIKVDGGYLTIPETTAAITVNHNLGVVPNFAAIWVDGTDYDIIPPGSCVECAYQKNPYVTSTTAVFTQEYKYVYQYKHATSLNLLGGASGLATSALPTASVFNFVRGNADWAPLDVNGAPLRYRWVVGYMPIGE